MGKISVSLNESNSEFAAEKAGSDVEAFVNDLVAREQKREAAVEALRGMIQEGLESGISEETPQQIMQGVRDRLRRDGVPIKP